MFKTLKLTISALLTFSSAEKLKTNNGAPLCKALGLSGGGALGAYEAGALWGMYGATTDKNAYDYDVVTGVSAGALNAAGIALFGKGETGEMVKFLSDCW